MKRKNKLEKLRKAIRAATIAERKAVTLNKKLDQQLNSLSLICDCFDWGEASEHIKMIRKTLKCVIKSSRQGRIYQLPRRLK